MNQKRFTILLLSQCSFCNWSAAFTAAETKHYSFSSKFLSTLIVLSLLVICECNISWRKTDVQRHKAKVLPSLQQTWTRILLLPSGQQRGEEELIIHDDESLSLTSIFIHDHHYRRSWTTIKLPGLLKCTYISNLQ